MYSTILVATSLARFQFCRIYTRTVRSRLMTHKFTHLQSSDKDFSQRFEDILSLEVPQWVINPFINNESAEIQYQEELIEISTNEMFKASFKNGENLTEFRLRSTISKFILNQNLSWAVDCSTKIINCLPFLLPRRARIVFRF